jgi:adenosylhomocysteine nucleosidase
LLGVALVVVTSDLEWLALCDHLRISNPSKYIFGEYFEIDHSTIDSLKIVIAKVGWGKISSASATQYAIDRWKPFAVLNIGTCGGLASRVQLHDIVLATSTCIYDLHVEIGDPVAEHAFYTTILDIGWLSTELSFPVVLGGILTADSDLMCSKVPYLLSNFPDAVAADWESGAIAFVVSRNRIPCVILRYVSDLVYPTHGDVYGDNQKVFVERVRIAMSCLASTLQSLLGKIAERNGQAL